MNVFELADRYRTIDTQLRSIDTLPAADREAGLQQCLDELKQCEDDMTNKMENLAFMICNREALMAARMEQAQRMKESCAVLANEIERMKWLGTQLLTATNRKSIDTPHFTLRWQMNPGRALVKEEGKLPAYYWKTVPAVPERQVVDLIKLGADLRQGVAIDGAQLVREPRFVID